MKLINDVITFMIDPNLYFSRFSFLESGMDAITLKQEVIIALLTSYLESLISSKAKEQVLHEVSARPAARAQPFWGKSQSHLRKWQWDEWWSIWLKSRREAYESEDAEQDSRAGGSSSYKKQDVW